MKKTKAKRTKQNKTPRKLSEVFLEHAARETAYSSHYAKECEYQQAANALTRRGVWLLAALVAQERKL